MNETKFGKYIEYYPGLKKEWNFDTCHNINKSWGQYVKWNILAKRTNFMILLEQDT